MKRLLSKLKKSLGLSTNGNGHSAYPPPQIDLATELAAIREAEASASIAPGKLIHRFDYDGLELRLDRDVMGQYRITVNQGELRRYSFSVMSPEPDYEVLARCYDEIIGFLAGSRALRDLPRHEHLRGHYYGEHAE